MPSPEILFGPFRFNSKSRILTEGSVPVSLGARASAILSALIEASGQPVPKSELVHRAWPGLTVDSANLKVQISGLRRALGGHKGMIQSEGSLGYRFVGDLQANDRLPAAHCDRKLSSPIGRSNAIDNIAELLTRERMITILGPAGIGKTTVALEIARNVEARYPSGTMVIDCVRETDARSALAKIMGAIPESTGRGLPLPRFRSIPDNKRSLVVLDSADCIVDEAADIVERILGDNAGTDILVTSREPLRVDGEIEWRLKALETVPASLKPTVEDIETYASSQLFVRAAQARAIDFQIDASTAATIAEICRGLDGIPLAIEFAGSMVGVLGLDEVHRLLEEWPSLLALDRRASVPHQRSMRASIAWSYRRLPETEKRVLRRLSGLDGWFTPDAAEKDIAGKDINAASVRNAVIALTEKSLLESDDSANRPTYRLLAMTRAFARQANDMSLDYNRAREMALPGKTRPCRLGTALPAKVDNPATEVCAPLNWHLGCEFLSRRLASFHRGTVLNPARGSFMIGSDRSGRVPLM